MEKEYNNMWKEKIYNNRNFFVVDYIEWSNNNCQKVIKILIIEIYTDICLWINNMDIKDS